MPEFSTLPVDDAQLQAETADIPRSLAEYVDFISRLPDGQAGRLKPSAGEDVRLVRMRLGAAARKMRKKVIIRKTGDEVLFWVGAA